MCQVWLKSDHWFWRKRWKCKKFTQTLIPTPRRQATDKSWQEKLTWAFGSNELKKLKNLKLELKSCQSLFKLVLSSAKLTESFWFYLELLASVPVPYLYPEILHFACLPVLLCLKGGLYIQNRYTCRNHVIWIKTLHPSTILLNKKNVNFFQKDELVSKIENYFSIYKR